MTHLPIALPLSVARCPASRTVHCSVANECARALVDGQGRFSQDFSIEPRGSGLGCTYHMPAHNYRTAAPIAGPAVHESWE